MIKSKYLNLLWILGLYTMSCNLPYTQKKIIKIQDGDFYKIGSIFKDSLFHGEVKILDSNNNFIGYSYYSYGIKNGPEVFFYSGKIISDSFNYLNGYEDGFAYKFDTLGKLQYRSQYFRGIPSGSTTVYSKTGAIKDYYFSNLDGEYLYRITPINDSVFKEKGKLINFQISPINSDGKNKILLSLYLLDNPFIKTHYAIAVLDENKKIIESHRIVSKELFFQKELEPLGIREKYAIVYYQFNSSKGRDDLIVQEIE